MGKTLLYRLFNVGGVPRHAAKQIHSEGLLLQDEGIGGSVTYRKYRASGKYYGWRRSWFSGSIVLTRDHFLAFKYSEPIIGVSWNDEKFKELHCSIEARDRICVGFEASKFYDDRSGKIEVRFSTLMAEDILNTIKQEGS